MRPTRSHRTFLILAVVVAAGLTHCAAAQTPVQVRIGQEVLALRGARTDWKATTGTVAIDPSWGYASLEYRRSERFGVGEDVGIADIWFDFRRGSTVNARVWMAPGASVHPLSDVLLEGFLAVGSGWEPAIQVRRMHFSTVDVWMGAVALAHYTGSWYLRVQGLVADDGRSYNPSLALAARRYLREPDRFVELRWVTGREVIQTGADGLLTAAGTGSMSAMVRWGLTERLSLHASLGRQDDRALGTRIAASGAVSVGL